MVEIKIIKDGKETRTIEPGSDNFVMLFESEYGILCDKADANYLKFDDKHVLDMRYADIIYQLMGKYGSLLCNVNPDEVCIWVDEDWEPTENSNNNSRRKINIRKVSSRSISDVMGFKFQIELRRYWVNQWTSAQLAAAIMSQLLRIDTKNGLIRAYSEDEQSRMTATFGNNYLEPGVSIGNLLEDNIKICEGRQASGQVHMDELGDEYE